MFSILVNCFDVEAREETQVRRKFITIEKINIVKDYKKHTRESKSNIIDVIFESQQYNFRFNKIKNQDKQGAKVEELKVDIYKDYIVASLDNGKTVRWNIENRKNPIIYLRLALYELFYGKAFVEKHFARLVQNSVKKMKRIKRLSSVAKKNKRSKIGRKKSKGKSNKKKGKKKSKKKKKNKKKSKKKSKKKGRKENENKKKETAKKPKEGNKKSKKKTGNKKSEEKSSKKEKGKESKKKNDENKNKGKKGKAGKKKSSSSKKKGGKEKGKKSKSDDNKSKGKKGKGSNASSSSKNGVKKPNKKKMNKKKSNKKDKLNLQEKNKHSSKGNKSKSSASSAQKFKNANLQNPNSQEGQKDNQDEQDITELGASAHKSSLKKDNEDPELKFFKGERKNIVHARLNYQYMGATVKEFINIRTNLSFLTLSGHLSSQVIKKAEIGLWRNFDYDILIDIGKVIKDGGYSVPTYVAIKTYALYPFFPEKFKAGFYFSHESFYYAHLIGLGKGLELVQTSGVYVGPSLMFKQEFFKTPLSLLLSYNIPVLLSVKDSGGNTILSGKRISLDFSTRISKAVGLGIHYSQFTFSGSKESTPNSNQQISINGESLQVNFFYYF